MGIRVKVGFMDSVRDKVDKIFLRAPEVFMVRWDMDTRGRHLWQLTIGRRPLGRGAGVVGVLGPAESPAGGAGFYWPRAVAFISFSMVEAPSLRIAGKSRAINTLGMRH